MPKSLQESLANNVDDAAPIDAVTVNAFSTFSKLFPSAGYDSSNVEMTVKNPEQSSKEGVFTGLEYAWSGIIGVVSPHVRAVWMLELTIAIDDGLCAIYRRDSWKAWTVYRRWL